MTNEIAQVSLNTVSTVDNKRIPFGTRLKSTREAMGLERKDVASQLRLNEKIIVMMEKDRYPVDLPVTFIRGYLRSYAKFLQIPEFEIKKGIEPIKQKSMNIDPMTPIKQPDTITSGDYFMQFSTYLIIFTLFALVAMWWYTHSTQKTAASAIPVTEAANAKPAATETADNNNANTAPAEATSATDDNADKLSVNNDQLPSTDEEMAADVAKPTEAATAPNSAQETKPTEARATDKKPANLNTVENTNTTTEAKPKAKPEQTAAAANTAAEPAKLKPAQTTAAATKPATTPITTTPSSAVGEVIAGLEDTGDIATQIDQSSGEPVKHTAQRQKHN